MIDKRTINKLAQQDLWPRHNLKLLKLKGSLAYLSRFFTRNHSKKSRSSKYDQVWLMFLGIILNYILTRYLLRINSSRKFYIIHMWQMKRAFIWHHINSLSEKPVGHKGFVIEFSSNLQSKIAAMAQWVRAFTPQSEGWVIECQS